MKTYAPLAAGYIGLVLLANWLASAYLVHVPLTPYVAPAGVFAIGGILVLRDWGKFEMVVLGGFLTALRRYALPVTA